MSAGTIYEHTQRRLTGRDNKSVDILWEFGDNSDDCDSKTNGRRWAPVRLHLMDDLAAYFSPTTVTFTELCTSACRLITTSYSPM